MSKPRTRQTVPDETEKETTEAAAKTQAPQKITAATRKPTGDPNRARRNAEIPVVASEARPDAAAEPEPAVAAEPEPEVAKEPDPSREPVRKVSD